MHRMESLGCATPSAETDIVRRMARTLLTLCLLLAVAPLSHAEEEAASEGPQKVDVCELLANPGAYNHKLVRVTARVSRGFEDFSLRGGGGCADAKPLWLEYGGPKPAEATFCCKDGENPPNGNDPLHVEGVRTSLKRDAIFRRFDIVTGRLRRAQTVQATLVGRVFMGGTVTSDSGEELEVGYGHMGLFGLFVIEQVLNVGER
jgi:hypothetical protein